VALVIVAVSVNNRDLQTIHKANGVNSDFAIIKAIIYSFNGWPLENPACILKGDFSPFDIAPVLLVIPSVSHLVYLHNANILCKGKNGALGAVAGRGLRAAAPASALGLRRAGLPQKLAGNDCQLVEGAGRSRRVG